ncbi:Small-conductance mechanosensitive channel [Maribacter sedimenticola]|uniref:Small-conductance mechanosensitive channel n=1 Tax=Maribacter sedimenticola TaxID=228956 RepID=A0ABY1SCT6_9FLAO|nr:MULTISPECIES: mechanosensitive ion channel domain-containing protein [Maribacter]TVZ16314.1 small-conductance mechanosensitive channel [Maribacter sp. MAR_2009_72]SNR25724.1 Small-conductance mechanosensitive channel [Maribacter sedimenticola]
MNTIFDTIPKNDFYLFLASLIAILVAYWLISHFLRKFGKDPKYLLPEGTFRKISWPIFFTFISILIRSESLRTLLQLEEHGYWFKKASTVLFIFSITWLMLNLLKMVKKVIISNYDVRAENNLKARKIYTQFNILERIFIFTIIILAIGAVLMSFESIRELGVSIFASAGVAGIIIGFSAQKMIGTVLAGIQIAIAQPIKMDDVVIVEGEWGRIEEITLTYVVVKIWDKRRLIVPTPYFIEKPFQNWTKTSSDILGTVFLYTDYKVPFDELRKELTKILESTPLWDKEVNVLQVTDSKQSCVEIRALMSAKDSSTAWDLRVLVREKLITFLQENYPESIVRTRIQMEQGDTKDNNA